MKLSKRDVDYRFAEPDSAERCENCVSLDPPAACEIVRGVISPNDTCDEFELDPEKAG